MRIAYFTAKGTKTPSEYAILSHDNNAYAKDTQCYVIRTTRVLVYKSPCVHISEVTAV